MTRGEEQSAPVRLSIIVPALDESDVIRRTLSALESARRGGCEVLLVDGGSRDDTPEQARGLVDGVLTSAPGRAGQMNVGAGAARGEVLWFIHADTLVPAEAWRQVIAAGHGAWGRFNLRLDGAGWQFRVIEAAINLRARLTGVATGDQALFVSRRLFESLGGFPDIPLMEDLQLTRRLRGMARMRSLSPPVVTSARRWKTHGIWRTVVLMWRLRFQWWCGVAPEKLAAKYRRQ